jgi:hypothetical protein
LIFRNRGVRADQRPTTNDQRRIPGTRYLTPGTWLPAPNAQRLFSSFVVRRSSLVILSFLLALPNPASAQKKTKPSTRPKISDVFIDQYKTLTWEPETDHFVSPGHVRITLEDSVTHQKTILIADDAEGTPDGDIVVKGKLRLERAEGTVTGRTLTYHVGDRTGIMFDARAQVANILLNGERLEVLQNQELKAFNANFTTCIKPTPDYHITAHELTVSNTRSRTVRAKHVSLWLGRTKIITLPSMKRNFGRKVDNAVPMPGYSKENLAVLRLRDDVLDEPKVWFNYDFQLSVLRTPQLSSVYEYDLGNPDEDQPPPRTRRFAAFEPLRTALETTPALLNGSVPEEDIKRVSLYGMLSTGNYVYNRKRTDIRVIRLPEIGISFRNILNRQQPTSEDAPKSVFGTGFFSPANWFINAEAGLGYFQERPTNTNSTRLSFRADATSPLFRISGPVYVRYGGTAWANLYNHNNAYTLLSPEAELNILLRPNTLIGAAYRYQQDFGKTPFLFDQRDVKHELRLRYAFLGAHWAYDTEIKYDMERLRAYDSVFSIRRRLDCLESGVAFGTRSQSINFILNLLPGSLNTVETRGATSKTSRATNGLEF